MKQSPNSHKYNREWAQESENAIYDIGDHNFCRDPSDSGYAWCYTIDGDWDRCDCVKGETYYMR